ncbi:GrpB family protein [Thalassobacillus hwangdonensis]|uniref:GrpB family protein n=1 Tax=Thalassobacillus hwangdonensis TaxID=546108 RepID=A0ABW3L5F7_9BACI
MRKVEVVKFDETWSRKFEEEKEKLRNIFGNELVAVHHIGSTSVEGLKAKPIIDILPVVKDIEKVDSFNEQMEAIGYEPMGEFGLPGRRYFRKGGDQRTHHIHMYEESNNEIDRHLAFRDYLRTHPDERERYGNLKEELAKQYPNDMESYINGKDSYVKEMERKALDWYEKR